MDAIEMGKILNIRTYRILEFNQENQDFILSMIYSLTGEKLSLKSVYNICHIFDFLALNSKQMTLKMKIDFLATYIGFYETMQLNEDEISFSSIFFEHFLSIILFLTERSFFAGKRLTL